MTEPTYEEALVERYGTVEELERELYGPPLPPRRMPPRRVPPARPVLRLVDFQRIIARERARRAAA